MAQKMATFNMLHIMIAMLTRMTSVLKQLGRGKVLFTHEDMILCDTVDELPERMRRL